MIKVLLFIWQLPQNLTGLVVLLIHYICGHKPKKETKYRVTVYKAKHVNNCGVSLGNFIFLDSDVGHSQNDYKHEHGHQIQSKYLGPLYLLVIGLPSVIGNIIWSNTRSFDYYRQPWELWADKLGGVKR